MLLWTFSSLGSLRCNPRHTGL